ncbi:Major facilitator superfamily domain general substrate transporter [Penicillium chrysogenum]|nr:Major facilitator superfamily domain general substrate transporter [Penicillium chrysogenum]
MIPVFGCLPFFTKYLDQQAITNAYVSLLLAYAHANKHCVADPGNWNETGNGTLHIRLCLGAESEYDIRNALLIEIYESCSFTGVIYVIGSSYKPGEMTCRVALFFVSTWDYVCGLHAGCCLYGFQWEAWIVWVETRYFMFPDVPRR